MTTEQRGAGVAQYLKEAFLFRWNLLLLTGAAAASMLIQPDILLPLVGAVELTYLAGLVSIPKFRAAIDAKVNTGAAETLAAPVEASATRSINAMLRKLPPDGVRRFERLRGRCLQMRSIADDVRGRAEGRESDAEEIRTPALDRLLWVFLKLLVSQHALQRFLQTTREEEITKRLEQLRSNMTAAKDAGDDRIFKSLQDSLAMTELRLDNYRKAQGNARFVAIELDRIEEKIQALTEMSINRQDPDFLTSQVDSVAETMRQTEKAISEMQHLTGLEDELQDPPPILDAQIKEVVHDG